MSFLFQNFSDTFVTLSRHPVSTGQVPPYRRGAAATVLLAERAEGYAHWLPPTSTKFSEHFLEHGQTLVYIFTQVHPQGATIPLREH